MPTLSRLEIGRGVTFDQAILTHPELVERGRYGRILEQYLRHVPRERVLVLFYDDLVADPADFLGRLCGFLGAEPVIPAAVFDQRDVTARAVRHEAVARTVFGARNLVRTAFEKTGNQPAWEGFTRRFMGLYHRILALNEREVAMDPGMRRELVCNYEEDIGLLARISGRNLDHWQ